MSAPTQERMADALEQQAYYLYRIMTLLVLLVDKGDTAVEPNFTIDPVEQSVGNPHVGMSLKEGSEATKADDPNPSFTPKAISERSTNRASGFRPQTELPTAFQDMHRMLHVAEALATTLKFADAALRNHPGGDNRGDRDINAAHEALALHQGKTG